MATRGFLIRFIDIGLIVLFGFLMISDIEASSRVELAESAGDEEEMVTALEERRAILVVEIGPDGAFTLTDQEAGEEAIPIRIAGVARAEALDALSRWLMATSAAHGTRGLESVVVIRPHPASWVQSTVDVMDACDRLSLTKSLGMDIEIESVPGAGEGAR